MCSKVISSPNHLVCSLAILLLACNFNSHAASPPGCKPVYSDSFGTIFVEGSSFSIATSSCSSKGVLHSDVFGNVYCGKSPFSISQLKQLPPGKGVICRDPFGSFYIQDQPFKIDVSGIINLK